MKRLLIALALFFIPALAQAQCNGVFPNNTVCGNVTGAANTPRPTNPSVFLGAAGGLNGQIQQNVLGALGGLGARVVTAAGAVSVVSTDYLVVINKSSPAATTVNLPSTPNPGWTYRIKDGKGDAWTNAITITPVAGTIDGKSTYVLNVGFGSVDVVYNGTGWNVE